MKSDESNYRTLQSRANAIRNNYVMFDKLSAFLQLKKKNGTFEKSE